MKAYRFTWNIDELTHENDIYIPDLNIFISPDGVDNYSKDEFDLLL